MGRNFHLEKILTLSQDYKGISGKIASKELYETASSFEVNMARVEMLLGILPAIIAFSLDDDRLCTRATYSVYGTINPSLKQKKSKTLWKKHQDEFNRLRGERMSEMARNKDKVGDWAWATGTQYLGMMTQNVPGQMVFGFEALLGSMVTGSWTAFEVLAADLWEACLNARPRLGVIALNAEPEASDDDLADAQKRGIKYHVPVHLLQKWDYNLQNRMGSLLRGKWDFAQHDKAIDAYLRVFKDSEGKKLKELSQILKDQNLAWLDALRNVLVHNAGIADARFMSRIKKHSTLKLLKEKEPVLLNGELLLPFINTVIQRGIGLIKFIDDWLAKNPN